MNQIMNRSDLDQMIIETIELGNQLIFKQFKEIDFSNYKTMVSKISDLGIRTLRDKIQLKTCQIIGTMQVDSFRLNLIQQIFFSDGKGTYGKVNAKNTDKMIKKRYVLNINRYLPILKTNQ
mgnify:CR=1 FL=1